MEMKNMLFYEAARLVIGPIAEWHFRIKVEGAEYVPEDGGGLIAANHRSLLDPVAIAYSVDRFVNFAAADWSFKMPIIKQLFTWAGSFPLSVYGGEESNKNILKAQILLENDELVGIFPEGVQSFFHPNRETKIAPFKTGFAKLALNARVPVIPCAVAAEEEVELPKVPGFLVYKFVKLPVAKEGQRQLLYKGIHCRIGRPIDLSEYYDEPVTKAVLDTIAERVRSDVVKLYNGEYEDAPAKGRKSSDSKAKTA